MIASVRRRAEPGLNTFAFGRRFGRETLRPGTYTLTVGRTSARPVLVGLIRVRRTGVAQIRRAARLERLTCRTQSGIPWAGTITAGAPRADIVDAAGRSGPVAGVAGVRTSFADPHDARPRRVTALPPLPPSRGGGYSLLAAVGIAVALAMVTAVLGGVAAAVLRSRPAPR